MSTADLVRSRYGTHPTVVALTEALQHDPEALDYALSELYEQLNEESIFSENGTSIAGGFGTDTVMGDAVEEESDRGEVQPLQLQRRRSDSAVSASTVTTEVESSRTSDALYGTGRGSAIRQGSTGLVHTPVRQAQTTPSSRPPNTVTADAGSGPKTSATVGKTYSDPTLSNRHTAAQFSSAAPNPRSGTGFSLRTTADEPDWKPKSRFHVELAQDQHVNPAVPRGPSPQHIPSLPQTRLNALQREVLALIVKGQSVLMTSGRHSGRCTAAAIICDRLIDPTIPVSLAMPIIVLCGIHQQRRLFSLLEPYILEGRVTLMSDLEYKERPFGAVLSPEPQSTREFGDSHRYAISRNSTGELSHRVVVAGDAGMSRGNPAANAVPTPQTPLLLIVANARYFDPVVAADAYTRFERRPQVVGLLDEAFPEFEENLGEVMKAGLAGLPGRNVSGLLPLKLGVRATLRGVATSLAGSGHILVPAAEPNKYDALREILAQMFDYQFFLIICATKRKAEKLAVALASILPTMAANHRAPQSIAAAQDELLNAVSANAAQLSINRYGPRSALLRRRFCITCDLNTIPLLAPCTPKVDLIVYYDMPDNLAVMETFSQQYFTPSSVEDSSSFITSPRRAMESRREVATSRIGGGFSFSGGDLLLNSSRAEHNDPRAGSAGARGAKPHLGQRISTADVGQRTPILQVAFIEPQQPALYKELRRRSIASGGAMQWVTVDV
jgi:hypothetical protein